MPLFIQRRMRYVEKLKTEWEAYKSLEIEGALKDTIPFKIPAKGALNHAQSSPVSST